MAKQIFRPFADEGDKSVIPETTQPSGEVSWAEGYGFDYSRIPGSSPLAKEFPRAKHNQVLYDLSGGIQQYQQFGAPEWYDDTLYAQYARVRHLDQVWVSSVPGNLTEPGSSITWVPSNIPATARQNNLTATTDPTAGDDSADGYEPLSQWINTVTTEIFVCISAAVGAAVWEKGTLTVDELGNMALINGTTVGQNLAQVANPSAIRFIRINANNSISLLDAAAYRTAIGAAAPLAYFTESESTATPNASTPVSVLTATGPEANRDLVLSAKGGGAISARVPDNTTVGGNKRGAYAVDLQLAPAAADEVASGSQTFAAGGNNRVFGPGAAAVGTNNDVEGAGSFASGNWGSDRGAPSWVRANGTHSGTSGKGAAQTRNFVFRRETANASTSPLTATTSGTSPGAGNSILLPVNSSYCLTGTVMARESATGDVKRWDISALVVQGATASTTAFVGTPTVTSPFASAGAAAWDVTLTINTTLGAVIVNAVGEAAKTIRWVASLETLETIGLA